MMEGVQSLETTPVEGLGADHLEEALGGLASPDLFNVELHCAALAYYLR